jgi:hypothetical protein
MSAVVPGLLLAPAAGEGDDLLPEQPEMMDTQISAAVARAPTESSLRVFPFIAVFPPLFYVPVSANEGQGGNGHCEFSKGTG